ncbi:hemolysin family protein [Intestinimonas butyriciproducens]|uniref:CBS domain protein n=1 Tax=Intestinimonas butyriciproducens TaxID=1297617 RepID=A0A2U1CDG7_9FIRM|nr:hemolysin family protein [Intestinimonas butyriciproducens]SCJ29663.1 Magnesium and cobalt efflux protein CorC [uncultured Clostridium sp.]MCI6364435.1 hemolysin family protein [Intestinimonas butyriciproducens]MCR1905900.1 hemolysin family protein [Intestinimonas butyriciproducens]MDB7830557.1 hemolysin family protein [Intestinimonas butyriciproducens]MDB7860888.1 hemolysin family protein [Intestinimonas butyriciproducens]
MLPDPLWPYILAGAVLFLAGALLSAAIGPFGRALNRLCNAFLRVTRIKPDAGLQSVSEDELRALMDLSEEKGSIEADEKEMIENVFDFNDTVAEDVMVHRTDMVMLWTGDTDEEIVQTIEDSGLSRFPVYEEDADDIVGILSTRDYLLNARRASPKPLKELLRAAYFIPESVRADVLFRDMQSKKVHMAIVVDEYGGTSGLVTMEDLLEEIVGNIYDEFDPQEDQEIIQLEPNLWRISGSAELEDVAEALEMEFPEDEESDTLGGLVFDQLSVIPEDGSKVEVDTHGLHIKVESIVDRRVDWALVSKCQEEEESQA